MHLPHLSLPPILRTMHSPASYLSYPLSSTHTPGTPPGAKISCALMSPVTNDTCSTLSASSSYSSIFSSFPDQDFAIPSATDLFDALKFLDAANTRDQARLPISRTNSAATTATAVDSDSDSDSDAPKPRKPTTPGVAKGRQQFPLLPARAQLSLEDAADGPLSVADMRTTSVAALLRTHDYNAINLRRRRKAARRAREDAENTAADGAAAGQVKQLAAAPKTGTWARRSRQVRASVTRLLH
jgi:hypothetical protein